MNKPTNVIVSNRSAKNTATVHMRDRYGALLNRPELNLTE